MSDYTFVLIPSESDAILLKGNYCDLCCKKKLNYILKFKLTIEEVKDLKKNSNIKGLNIKCECQNDNSIISLTTP
uniref:Uncharacterized protein n=1 Tax=viral metagenome TaxID=1070528 RepID=A0A6C0AEZ9_9ZZZZ